jgi:Rrf2 family nitric oxide-sensitive transcriptional repressor
MPPPPLGKQPTGRSFDNRSAILYIKSNNSFLKAATGKSPMFSSTAEYALRAMVHLATHRDQACTAQEIAATTMVPGGYVSKVLQDLVRAGIVESQRGPNGGFTLARDPAEVSLLEVVNAVDPFKRIQTCPLGLPAHGSRLCRLHQKLDDAIESVEQAFGASSIAEMLEPSKAGSRCLFPSLKAPKNPTKGNQGGG